MAPDPRRVAIDAVLRIDETAAYANVLLPKMLADAGLSSRDRAFVTELVYGSTRRKRALDHVVDRFLVQDPPPLARAALRIGAHQLIEMATPPHAAVSATVGAAPKRFRGLVNAVLRKVAALHAQGIDYPTAAVELSYPDWLHDRLVVELGPDRALAAMRVMNEPATVQRRADGYIQDESSRRVAASVPVAAGDRVLDLCAAPGGKATEIAGRGAFVAAADLRLARAGLITANAARLGLDSLVVIQADGTAPPFRDERFGAVLVDAPCSGLGALRRRPDARWRVEPDDIEALADLQRALVEAATPLVAPGGTLVYSVCTLVAAESTDVVAAAAPSLRRAGFAPIVVDDDGWEPFGDDVEILLPATEHDGMCRSVWRRS